MKSTEQMETIGLMMRTLRKHRLMCEQMVQEMGLHDSQHRMLMHLSHCDSMPSQKELAEKMHISPAAVAVTVRKLECGGFISRASDKKDKRQNRLEITEKGKAVIHRTEADFSDLDMCMFGGFTDEEFVSFKGMLIKMNSNLDERKSKDEKMA